MCGLLVGGCTFWIALKCSQFDVFKFACFFVCSSYSVHSARPSSRSSIRSNNSFGSYGHRRLSSAPHSNSTAGSKGILVSTSRSGAARSAAILLISSHISATNKTNNSQRSSDENMKKHLQKQLKHQRQQLHLELPPNTARILTKLLKRGLDDEVNSEMNTLGNGTIEMGALPSPAEHTARVAVKSLIFSSLSLFLSTINHTL